MAQGEQRKRGVTTVFIKTGHAGGIGKLASRQDANDLDSMRRTRGYQLATSMKLLSQAVHGQKIMASVSQTAHEMRAVHRSSLSQGVISRKSSTEYCTVARFADSSVRARLLGEVWIQVLQVTIIENPASALPLRACRNCSRAASKFSLAGSQDSHISFTSSLLCPIRVTTSSVHTVSLKCAASL
jgi:hypothetical protein